MLGFQNGVFGEGTFGGSGEDSGEESLACFDLFAFRCVFFFLGGAPRAEVISLGEIGRIRCRSGSYRSFKKLFMALVIIKLDRWRGNSYLLSLFGPLSGFPFVISVALCS